MSGKGSSVQCDSTVLAINEFIMSTVSFLNSFASTYSAGTEVMLTF